VDTGERVWSSSYDEPSDSADLIRVGHRVAAAVARAIANPCGILHREGLVDTA
jgi:TolB-like protein